MKRGSNQFMLRVLRWDGQRGGRVLFAELEKIEPPARRKKFPGKRIPIIYRPGLATFPRISFAE